MITTFIQKKCTNGKSAFSFQGQLEASLGVSRSKRINNICGES